MAAANATVVYATLRKVAMTNAVDPIIGGNRTPPVEAQDSTPAAYSFSIPFFCIAGIVIWPVVRTLVITLPLIEPIRPLDTIATLAEPPLT